MRLSSQQYRRMILATDLAWDPDHIPDKLVLYDEEGNVIDLLDVQGPMGPPGPPGGGDSIALTAQPVLDVGLPNQIRAGRQLINADFTDMGLSVPLGLWNLSDLVDASGNGRALTNKGAVPFTTGINGFNNTGSRFSGNVAQALYIPDTGAADPFRIKAGTYGCWFKTARPGVSQYVFSKSGGSVSYGWGISVNATSKAQAFLAISDGAFITPVSVTTVADGRWHFAVVTYDGAVGKLYIDGVIEDSDPMQGSLQPSPMALNIGAINADGATNAVGPFYGSVDEAFVTRDILSDDQIRNLYCVKIPHTLGVTPTRASLSVRRVRRSGALALADFSTQPLRMYNFVGGSLADEGSQNVPVTATGTGGFLNGVDGTPDSAYHVNGGGSLASSDAGLPAALTTRSYGCWVKCSLGTGVQIIMSWGLDGSTRCALYFNTGALNSITGGSPLAGPYLADGHWHHIVSVEDNTASDGGKRKLYVDGRLYSAATTMGSNTLGGANKFRIGCDVDGTSFFTGQIDGVFVAGYAVTADEVFKLYAKGVKGLPPSPKNSGDHVEAWSATNVLATFDSLDSNAQVDLGVAT